MAELTASKRFQFNTSSRTLYLLSASFSCCTRNFSSKTSSVSVYRVMQGGRIKRHTSPFTIRCDRSASVKALRRHWRQCTDKSVCTMNDLVPQNLPSFARHAYQVLVHYSKLTWQSQDLLSRVQNHGYGHIYNEERWTANPACRRYARLR